MQHNENFARRYRELWRMNNIDGPDMEQLLRAWIGWLETVLGRGVLAEMARGIAQCFERHLGRPFQPSADLANCDPAFAGYIRMLMSLLRT
jgi:hypothetical protein